MIFKSPFPDVSVPVAPLTEFVFERAGEFAGKPAIIEGLTGRALTYAQLREQVTCAAAGFARLGVRKGEVVAILSPNVPEYAVAFHGAASAGAVVSTVNPLCSIEEVSKQLAESGAKVLVADASVLEKAREASAGTGVGELFAFGEGADATPFDALLEGGGEAPRVSFDMREDLAALPFSSGTTGVQKGVMLTHRNMVANLLQIEGTGNASPSDTLVCVLPLFHIYGMQVIMNHGLHQGATIVVLPRFDFEEALGVLERYRVTMAHFVPPIMLGLAKSPAVERFDLSALKTVFSAAAPLGREVAEQVRRRLGCRVKQGYGMTEASPATHMIPPELERDRPGSVGVPVPSTECKIVDLETGAELCAGREGEICVRGPQVMKGYLNRPDATAESIDAEGWLHTGDIGYADEDGFFFVVDRAKELIKYKGYQVAPAELEALLLAHPSIADAAVVPHPDEEAGEIPKAFVVLRDGHALSAEGVMGHVAAHVGPHKRVRLVEFVGQIPKSPSGKILRRLLRQRERASG
jgi:acyl-CoA synthetase (AMP-forming)/AMP-acid ligase II